jgi:hypothetical protein
MNARAVYECVASYLQVDLRTLKDDLRLNEDLGLDRPSHRRPPATRLAVLSCPAMGRTGSAILPLHGGKVPRWLSVRMAKLGRVVTEAIVHHYGRDELLRRLAHPFWFQSLAAVMGMDWHSSGTTTVVVSALKEGLADVEWELGIHVCGGRGARSRETPNELLALGGKVGLDAEALAKTSRLVAKVDSACVQDGFDLYIHGFIVTDDAKWTVVQQGMSPRSKLARRYHWLSEGLESFVEEPHAAIDGQPQGNIVNLTDHRAEPARAAQLELVRAGPDSVLREMQKALPQLQMPMHHEVTAADVVMRRLAGALAAAKERGPLDFADLLLTPGVGQRTVFALAQVAEVVHGTPCRFSDPARFSMAHGGKDGHPYPVPTRVYDETLRVMKDAIEKARLGNEERLAAIRRLDRQARALEATAPAIDFEEHVEKERAASPRYGGRTVKGWAVPRQQLGLPLNAPLPARRRPGTPRG